MKRKKTVLLTSLQRKKNPVTTTTDVWEKEQFVGPILSPWLSIQSLGQNKN